MRLITIALFATTLFSVPCWAHHEVEKTKVKIVQRQNNEAEHSVYIPGHSHSSSSGRVECSASSTTINCSGTTDGNETYTAPLTISYRVTGATLSLLLSDGRVVVVNCVGKPSLMQGLRQGLMQDYRSCRIPPVDDIQAEFKDKNAKLFWVAGINGKLLESETYHILAVLDSTQLKEVQQ